MRLIGRPSPKKSADLADIATATVQALELVPAGIADTKKGTEIVRAVLHGKWKNSSPRHARLAVGTAVTFAGFIAETYVERAALKNH